MTPGVWTVAAAVTDPQNRAIAAMGVSLPEARWMPAREAQVAKMVVQAANHLSSQLR